MKDQLYLKDDMRPPEEPAPVPEVLEKIHAWLDAKDEQAAAAERTKAASDAAMAALAEHGLEQHPYVDGKTGKRRWFVADTTPKPKTISFPRRRKQEDDVEIGEEVEATERPKKKAKTKPEDVVEKRRVSRTKEHDVMADPFAATRAGMETP